jgi:hypothetical protein
MSLLFWISLVFITGSMYPRLEMIAFDVPIPTSRERVATGDPRSW